MKKTEKIPGNKSSGHRKKVKDAKKLAARQARRAAKRDPEDAETKRRNRGWWD